MNARAVLIVGSVTVLGAAAFLASRRAAADVVTELQPYELEQSPIFDVAQALDSVSEALGGVAETVTEWVDEASFQLVGYRVIGGRWEQAAEKPENAGLVGAMHDAEARHGLPFNLVVRVAWQESRFNAAAYNARSDASGIMQIVPRWHPSVNPWDAFAAIDYGARYLAQLYRQFGTWELALKAYNWGPGNVRKWQAGTAVEPAETRNYSAQILADVRATGQVLV